MRPADDPIARVLAGTSEGRRTKGRTKQYEKHGDFEDALKDYDALYPRTARQAPDGSRIGETPDGTKIIVRPRSSDGRATLEIQRGGTRIKIRYGDKL